MLYAQFSMYNAQKKKKNFHVIRDFLVLSKNVFPNQRK